MKLKMTGIELTAGAFEIVDKNGTLENILFLVLNLN